MLIRRLLLAVLALATLSLLAAQSPGYAADYGRAAEETPTEDVTASPTDPATAIPTDPATPTTPATLTPTATLSPTVPPTTTSAPTSAPTNTALPTLTPIPNPTAAPTDLPPAPPTPIPQPTPAPLDGYLPLVFGWEPPPTATPLPTATPTLTPTVPPTATTLPDALINGNFEAGRVAWVETSLVGRTLVRTTFPSATVKPHSGAWAAWLGGADDETSLIAQQVTRPVSQPYLVYWVWIASADECGYDVGGVLIEYDAPDEDVVDSYWLCSSTSTGGWVQRVVDMRKYAGKTVTVLILAGNDDSLNSNMFVDDVAFQQQGLFATTPIIEPRSAERLREIRR